MRLRDYIVYFICSILFAIVMYVVFSMITMDVHWLFVKDFNHWIARGICFGIMLVFCWQLENRLRK